MLRLSVTSQIIASVGYDRRQELLEVEFRNGWIYQYDNVPPRVYEGLLNASSHGRFLHQEIVDQFTTRRIK